MNGTVHINLNLIFDYNSLLFCTLRSYLLPKGFNIQNNTRKLYELKSPEQAFNSIPADSKNHLCVLEEFLQLFSKNLKAIKPTIAAIDTLLYLKNQGINILLYTDISKLYLEELLIFHEKWLQPNSIIFCNDLKEVYDEANIIIEGDISVLNELNIRNQTVESKKVLIYIKNSDFRNKERSNINIEDCLSFNKWEDVKWSTIFPSIKQEISFPQSEYFLKLKEEPKGNNLLGYSIAIPLDVSVKCNSKVIHGQGKAAKQLGIPTANLEVDGEIEQKINLLLTGVYAGKAILNGNEYKSLFFIGSSQYFNDSKKQLECYVYHEFDHDFYGADIQTEIISFIRPEADFKEFGNELVHQLLKEQTDYLLFFRSSDKSYPL